MKVWCMSLELAEFVSVCRPLRQGYVFSSPIRSAKSPVNLVFTGLFCFLASSECYCKGIGNPTTRAQISSLQPPSKPAFCVRSHDHWASPGPDAALTRPFGATGSATSTARPTARSRRRPVCPLTNRCVDRARHRVLPGLTRPSPGRLAPPARHHLHPVRHTRPKAAARAPGRWAAPERPRRCAPGSA